ncbi:hypothetical protein BGZ63DRAFT_360808 [Mariannaea sp. PMI_226]|nr:hypothetical protein BGZ63DRAFT_360808 [Mariannaea sp. PMI_226]
MLSDIYFQNIHPIIPLLNKEEYYQCLKQSSIRMPLVHAVCLVAAKDGKAGQYLNLLHSGDALLSVRQFCTHLHASVLTDLTRGTISRKITLVRTLALLSLHHEGSNGAEQASSFLAQAVHYAQTMGLQLQRPRHRDNEAELKKTFWCLWTLDRLNAAIHSRPCCMADIDIAIDSLTTGESGSVAFDVWFRITQLLNQVIGLYRPGAQGAVTELDTDFPGFEGIVDEMQAWELPCSTIATLHIYYLATAILAHRLRTITALPSPTPARLRQQLSAIQIIRNMQDPNRLNSLCALPIVVYAPSLAISVFYQHLRYSRLPNDQEDARHDFNMGCNILQQLRQRWQAADPMAYLALRISTTLDTLPSLEVLRVDRSEMVSREEVGSEQASDERPTFGGDLITRPPAILGTLPDSQTMELLDGMNDVSWMYLDVLNPVSLESFPLVDYSIW